MTTKQKQDISRHAQEFITSHGMTNAQLAHRADVRPEYLTHIFRKDADFSIPTGAGKSTPIAPKYFDRIAAFIGLELKESYWEDKPTAQLVAMLSVLSDAKEYGETRIITGETGSGKSHTLDIYLRKHPADTFIITVGSSDNLGDLIDKICDELKITTGKTRSKKLGDIIRKMRQLREDGYSPQLIFDEAEFMKITALCAIKQLYDLLLKYASLILVGTAQLRENIETLKKRNKPGMPQFYRRVKFGMRALPAVDRSFSLFVEGLDRDVVKHLRTLCDNYGELHDVLVPVRRENARTGDPITKGMINRVLNISQYAA